MLLLSSNLLSIFTISLSNKYYYNSTNTNIPIYVIQNPPSYTHQRLQPVSNSPHHRSTAAYIPRHTHLWHTSPSLRYSEALSASGGSPWNVGSRNSPVLTMLTFLHRCVYVSISAKYIPAKVDRLMFIERYFYNSTFASRNSLQFTDYGYFLLSN